MVKAAVNFITQTTMYRAMLYYLGSLLGTAVVLSGLDILPFEPLNILGVAVVLLSLCWVFNHLFSRGFGVTPNPESTPITALILALIFGPLPLLSAPAANFGLLAFIALVAIGSKYLVVRKRSHIFNPAALGAVAGALFLGSGASWWVGSIYLLPLVVIGGLGMIYRLRRWELITSFLLTYLLLQFVNYLALGLEPLGALNNLGLNLLYSPLLFFTFVMLVEPMTSPGQKKHRIYYGGLVALGLVALENLALIGYSLELALLIGNVFAAIFADRGWLPLKLKKQERYSSNSAGFWFKRPSSWPFQPGQFAQWSLSHEHPDSRGIRRFFTVASSPTEKDILVVTKFSEASSSFKQALRAMEPGAEIMVTRPQGDFTLPTEREQQLVFIAGGIGITPYRSMIKYLLDKEEKRPLTLVYAARRKEELLFRELFRSAEKTLGMHTVYVLDEPPADWEGLKGPLDKELLQAGIKHHKGALFYVAGPEPLVKKLVQTLRALGVPSSQIKRDFFPGYKE